ncbi:N-acetylmuramoyl-L-alanine amidase [Romboutsia sp.]|uniref:N-acetylmuramoyl-L-alanine amidase n=1 Tax=Romboutsia sp. TaxID=1965302 RepID=UPI002C9772C8|nr:N-acetylmuramoyl-L-alanine amidase [Romboutsia sp.]HSQ88696.1 N-acetylmuramoyl-L-alanine amidase [Romboutsia sp.]
MSKKTFGGVGHGGIDPGAVANGLKESDINLDIAFAWKVELERHGVEVKLSRYKNENDNLNEEIRECNSFNPDLAIDFHTNAGGGDGFEVYHTIGGGLGKTLAQNIEKEVVALGQNSRGVKTRKNSSGKDYYGFIRLTKCPANIIECAFIDNDKDIAIVDTKEERIKFGKAVAKATLKTLGIQYKEENKPSTSTFYRVVCGSYTQRSNADAQIKALEKAGFKNSFIDIYKE